MKPSTELFNLIKSLSKSEKRFFKLSSSLQSGDKNYLRIFDEIEKQSDYDEEAVKNTFKGETFVKHFPSEKNHLYKLILKSLRSYHSDHSVSSILRQEIKNIEILYKKALYKECNKFVSRAKKIAIQNEKFYYLFELITWEKTLLEEAYESGNFDKNLDELIHEETEVIEKLRNLAEYHILYSKINYVFRSGGFARNAKEKEIVSEIANNHLIKGKNTALSTRAATICYYIKGLCASTNRDYKDSFQFFGRSKEIMDNNPIVRSDIAKRYVRTLGHLLFCYIDDQDYDEARDLITTMRSLRKEKGFNTVDIDVRIFTASYIGETMLYAKMGEYDKGLEIVDEIIDGISSFGDKINKEQEVVFSYNIAFLYFGAGKYNKALFWINKVLNDNEQTLRQDIYGFSRLTNLVIHYELGNLDLLEYIIKSTFRYLNKKEKDYSIETVILKHMKKLAKLGSDAERLAHFKEMKKDLDSIFKDKNERVVLDYFDFESWIDAKINGTTFDVEVRKKNLETA